jgi:hypothetical protein
MSQTNVSTHVLDELRALVAARWEDRLTRTMAARLEALVREEPGSCDLYIRMMCMHAELYQFASALCETAAEPSLESEAIESQPHLYDAMVMDAIREPQLSEATTSADDAFRIAPEPDSAAKPETLVRNWTKPWVAAAAVLLVSATALILILHQLLGGHSPQPIAMGASFDATWADQAPAAGNKVQTGMPRSLTSGYVELSSADGLVVVIQGPATFTVQRPGVISLDSGKLTASVPPKAHGFTVNTPAASIVDLGTEFGVNVSPEGETDVQTFRGTVALSPSASFGASSSPILITAGFARRVSPTGQVTEIPADKTDFVRTAEFESWKPHSAESSYRRWQAYSERLRHDTDLVAYYTFENTSPTGDRLPNLSSEGSPLDGILGGDDSLEVPAWATGRWPHKGALAFAADSNQRVEVPAPIGGPLDFSRGEQTASPFSIFLWIHADGPTDENGIVAKGIGTFESFSLETFGDKCLRGWVRDTRSTMPNAPLQDLIVQSGFNSAWEQVGMIYRPEAGRLELYRNGVLASARDDAPHKLLETDRPMIIGCREGNGSAPASTGEQFEYFPSFPGRIDELAIFRRALSAEQVREIYTAEKPD